MSKPKRYCWLRPGDCILTAYAQPAAGPGWTNRPLWVIVQNADMSLRRECIQPEEQTAEMALLYNVSATVSASLLAHVEVALRKVKP